MAGLEEAGALAREGSRLDALAAYGVLDTPAEQDFDDLVHLAAELCAAPVALVSFVAADRQWFKARVGFSPCQTDLDSSVCRFVLAEPDLLVIPDLELDARTRDNPLVTGEPRIRFYAGAPLRTPEGQALGSLCVIDTEPRPGGLAPDQADNLRKLARQVMGQLELRRLAGEREDALARTRAASEALARSEARWRGLFENLQEGFILGEPLRDGDGRIVDWRYLEVNAAWSELVGVPRAAVIGKTVREVLPGVEPEWIDLAGVVDTGETLTFTRKVEDLDRWYDGRAGALGPDLFSVLFLEVTERVRTAEMLAASAVRKAALAELGDHLRTGRSADAMSFIAASILGRTLGACRAGYGSVDPRRDTLSMASDWCAPGFASLKGDHSFRDYGAYIDELKQGCAVDVSDVRSDPRTADHSEALQGLGVTAFYNTPVMENGRMVALCYVHFDQPHEITPEEQGFVRAVADRTQVGIARLESEERQAVLNGEISHRLKNVLAMVQAVAAQTLKGRAEPDAVVAFNQRLAALSRAQDVLMQSERMAAEMASIVQEVLDLAGVRERCRVEGPSVRLGPRAALSTSLLLHELATNAQKYGALSRPDGTVHVDWRLDGEAEDAVLVLDWREEGGPPATAPTRKGFGTRLLRTGLVGTGGSDLVFSERGFSASFRAPLRQVEQA